MQITTITDGPIAQGEKGVNPQFYWYVVFVYRRTMFFSGDGTPHATNHRRFSFDQVYEEGKGCAQGADQARGRRC
jgi:hypothetical protein